MGSTLSADPDAACTAAAIIAEVETGGWQSANSVSIFAFAPVEHLYFYTRLPDSDDAQFFRG